MCVGTVIRYGSYYGKPNKTIHLSNVQCTGDEKGIDSCNFKSYSLEEGKNKLNFINVAGVKCHGQEVTSLSSFVPTHPWPHSSMRPSTTHMRESKAASQDSTSIVLSVLVGILLIAVFILLATSIMLR